MTEEAGEVARCISGANVFVGGLNLSGPSVIYVVEASKQGEGDACDLHSQR